MPRVAPDVRRWAACAAVMLAAACSAAPQAPDLDALAARYVQLVRELARHDPSLIDHWLTEPPANTAGPRRPVSTLHIEIDALARAVAIPVVDGPADSRGRAAYLAGQSRALRLAAQRLLGESLPFDVEARLAFGLTPTRADLFQADRARETLERLLPGTGSLGERLARFRARFRAPQAARATLMDAALAACRDAVRDAIPFPSDASVDVSFVAGLPWDAHARALGGHRTRIEVHDGVPLDLTRALRLACHEGYAGHHAQHVWIADGVLARLGWTERALVPGFGPALLIAEGAAEVGSQLAMPPATRAAVYRDRLAPAAGLRLDSAEANTLVRVEQAQAALEPLVADIAREYLDNHITAARAIERLEQEVLMPGAESFLPFIERRRTSILAYTEGARVAWEQLAAAGSGTAGLAALRALFVP
jgi:hypothetical protein